MEDLSKFTDQELCDRWREAYALNRKLRAELERREYRFEWKTVPIARSWSHGSKIKDQPHTEYRFTKTEVKILA